MLGVWDFIDSITPTGCRKRDKTIEAPSGGRPKLDPLNPDSLLLNHLIIKIPPTHKGDGGIGDLCRFTRPYLGGRR